jgi:DNA-binding CsgD family transcriptional regulator
MGSCPQRLGASIKPRAVQYANEGRAWLSESLALSTTSNSVGRARALISASTLVAEQGEYATARPLIEEALAHARDLGDGPTLAFALFRAAQLSWFRREFATARDLADEGVAIGRALGLRNLEGINLWQSAQAAHDLGDPGARALAERAVDHFTNVENPTMLGCALTTLAQVHLKRGDLDTARRLLNQAVATHPPEFQGVAQMFSNVTLGWVAVEQGDLSTAHASLRAALRMAQDALGGRARLVTPLEGLAQLAAAVGEPVRALRLAGAAANLRQDWSTPPTPTEVRQLDRWLAPARADVGPNDADEAWTAGGHLSPEQATVEAFAVDVGPSATRSVPVRPLLDLLTPRERDVALLVRDGLGTQDIAERLVITDGTVRVHIERILAKLQLHSRAQLAVWATHHSGGSG